MHEWFKPRGYKHVDVPVGTGFVKNALNSSFVERHSWSPLIHYVKKTKRYKPDQGRTVFKPRDIMYASHRDACILSKYANDLTNALEVHYKNTGLADNVVAYRRLGKSNYDFSAEAYEFALTNAPCVVLCFDITGFFDHLDHSILKDRLKRILGVKELSNDWQKVFRNITRFRSIERDELAKNPKFGPRLKTKAHIPVATIAEIKAAGIKISGNLNPFGIPQGTPISSAFSNLYMIDLDRDVAAVCSAQKAFFRRYSDDVLIICHVEDESAIVEMFMAAVAAHKLEIKIDKMERKIFDMKSEVAFQYLGFNISSSGAAIRPSSLARQFRKLKRSITRTKAVGLAAVASGKAPKVFTKKLWRRFSPIGGRNFSSYARRAEEAFGSKKIARQVRRFERKAREAIREINK